MILQSLADAAKRFKNELSRPYYRFRQYDVLVTVASSGKMAASRVDDSTETELPDFQRTGLAKRPQLLADYAEYTFGVFHEGNEDRAKERHMKFLCVLDQCCQETASDVFETIKRNLEEGWKPKVELDPRDVVVWRSEGDKELLTGKKEFIQFWQRYRSEQETARSPTEGYCIACGDYALLSDRHPVDIRGLPGSQGTYALVSANKDAFLSYGLEDSLTSPVCWPCARQYANSLNYLLDTEDHSFTLYDLGLTYVFWTKHESPLESVYRQFMGGAADQDSREVRYLLESLWEGEPFELERNRFYALGMSASGSRIVIRDWIEVSISQAAENLEIFFDNCSILDLAGETREYGIWRLIASLCPSDSRGNAMWDSASPNWIPELIGTAVKGAIPPDSLLYAAVKRNRSEQQVTAPRASLIRLVLNLKGDVFMAERLEPERQEVAYQLGRLMSVLEDAQRRAIPGLNTTIVDKFYGTASTAPASVFGNLLKQTQNHLSKVAKENPSAAYAMRGRITEIMKPIEPDEWPDTLNLKQQGYFALGFYHEQADRQKRIAESRERREQNAE